MIYATCRRPPQKRGRKEWDSVCADEEEFKNDDDDSDYESWWVIVKIQRLVQCGDNNNSCGREMIQTSAPYSILCLLS